jgi:tetratricopeptide (TPR) repeat protein
MEQAAAGGSLGAFKRSLRAAYAVVGVMFVLGAGALIYDIYADTTLGPQETCERRVADYAWPRKKFHRVLEIADAAISSNPDWAMGHYFRAGALDELGRLEDSLTALDRVIELDPDKAYYYHARSEVLMKLKRWKEAKKALLEAIRLEPDREQYLKKLRFVKKRIEMEKRKHGSLRGNGNPAAE